MIIVNKERCLSAVKIDSTVTYSGQWTPHKDRVTHMQPSVSWSSASCSSQKLFLSVASDRKEFRARSCRRTADGSGWSGLFRSPHDPALLRSTHTHTRSRYNYCMDCDSCSALGPNAHLLHDGQINNTISGNWRAGRNYFTWYMCNRVKSIWELLYFIQIIMLRICEFYLKDLFLFTWMFPVETTLLSVVSVLSAAHSAVLHHWGEVLSLLFTMKVETFGACCCNVTHLVSIVYNSFMYAVLTMD